MKKTKTNTKMKPVYPQSDYAPISNFDAYTSILANNGSVLHDFVRPRGKRWVVLEPDHLLAELSYRYPSIYDLYEIALPADSDRATKFRTIMAALNIIATKSWKNSMSKVEFVEIVMRAIPVIPGGTNPWNKLDLMQI